MSQTRSTTTSAGRGYYVADERWGVQPENARLFAEALLIGHVRPGCEARARREIEQWGVNNDSEWRNCQRWVVEVIWRLRELRLLRVNARSYHYLIMRRQYWQ